MPIFSQNTISHAYVQSVHHRSCPYPISTPYLLPITSENPTVTAHVMSLHLSCHVPVRMPPKALCACPVRIPSFLPLYPCTVSIPPLLLMSNQSPYLLPMSIQFIISPTYIKYHLSHSCLVNNHISFPHPLRIPHALSMYSHYTTSSVKV